MEKIILRSQVAYFDHERKVFYLRIDKPMPTNEFSISDKALEWIHSGYRAVVRLPDRKQIIDKHSSYRRIIPQTSKFPNGRKWFLAVYEVAPKQEQLSFV